MHGSRHASRICGVDNPRKKPLHSESRAEAQSLPFQAPLWHLAGTNFRGNLGDSDTPITRWLSYTYVSPIGEVAEWPKAAVC
jgi:hypothetical protein